MILHTELSCHPIAYQFDLDKVYLVFGTVVVSFLCLQVKLSIVSLMLSHLLSCFEASFFKICVCLETFWQLTQYIFTIQQMSRVRQFGQVRESRRSEKGSLSARKQQRFQSAKRNLICVNCVNKSLSKQKHMKSLIQKQQQNNGTKPQIKDSMMRETVSKNRKIDDNYRQVAEYNTEKIKVHSAQKEFQKMKKLEQKKQIENQREKLLKERENIVKKEKTLKQKWFNELKEQLAEKEQLKQKEKQEKLQKTYLQQENMFNSLTKNREKQRYQRYKKDLQEQIKTNQQKKQAQKQEESKMSTANTNFLLDRAQQRQVLLLKQAMQKKRQLWEEAKEKQDKIAMQTYEKQNQDQKAKQQIVRREKQQEQRRQLIAKMRQNRMSEYMKQVKQQISQKEAIKRKQKQDKKTKFQKGFQTSSNKKKQLLACNSCQKEYPKNYLSEFQTNS